MSMSESICHGRLDNSKTRIPPHLEDSALISLRHRCVAPGDTHVSRAILSPVRKTSAGSWPSGCGYPTILVAASSRSPGSPEPDDVTSGWRGFGIARAGHPRLFCLGRSPHQDFEEYCVRWDGFVMGHPIGHTPDELGDPEVLAS